MPDRSPGARLPARAVTCCLTACWLLTGGLTQSQAVAQQGAAPASPRTAGPVDTRPQAQRQAPTARIAPSRITSAPRAPFPQLSAQEQLQLDEVLLQWEQQSQKTKTFTCKFKRWEHDKVFNNTTEGIGEIKYGNPDKGMYRFRDKNSDPQGPWDEYWVCDGESIFEFSATKKELIERVLPKEMHGTAIADGPFPFLFGASAQKLKQRYWLRLVSPPQGQENMVALEAYPKFSKDAANFRRAELLLTRKELTLFALQIHDPNGKNRSAHQFYSFKANDPFQAIKDFFAKPRAPRGWKHRVEHLATEPRPAGPARVPQQAKLRGPSESPR